MRHLIFLLCTLALATSCSTQKAVQKNIAASLDSLSRSERHRSFEQLDSLVTHLEMEFDTLEIVIERPAPETSPAQVVRMRAVRGTLNHSRAERSHIEQAERRCDTTAYRNTATDKSTESIERLAVYEPPKGALLLVVVLVLLFAVGALVVWRLRRRLF